MPRPLRIQSAGYVQHIISKGNDGQTLFQDSADFNEYTRLLETARNTYPVKIYNFCLMSNHIHLLVEPMEDGALSKFMELVTKEYAKYFNRRYKRSGHVFAGRYKSFIIQEERYFFACSRYIDLNSVKANIVEKPQDYKWSLYSALANGEKGPIEFDKHSLYQNLGANDYERQVSYRALIHNYQGDDLDLLNRSAGILGDKEFRKSLKSFMRKRKGSKR